MFNLLIIIYIIVLSLLSFLFCHIIINNNMKRDLSFFVIVNYILSFAFLIFLFYFRDYVFSLIIIVLLLINSIFTIYEIKLTYDKYKMLTIPYLIYLVFIFFILFDLVLMNR